MDKLLTYLESSIADEVFSRTEKKTFKSLVSESMLDQNRLNFLRSKIYELASQKITSTNHQFILEWVKTANSALIVPTVETTDAFFSPGDACRNTIIRNIETATEKLHICVFTISDDSITNSLLTAHKKGVNIKIITDNDKSFDVGSDVEQLARAGVAVKMDTTPNHMHHKFMVSDQRSLITGSYNWTLSAAKYNHENIIVTREATVVKSFAQQFDQLWNVMQKYNSD
jgi:phosphatidylserine/phosphatidylglycerophosphate/cardiolipin synthase-like enzyme